MTSKMKYIEAAIAAGATADNVVKIADEIMTFCEKGPARVADNVTCQGPSFNEVALDLECVYLDDGIVMRGGRGPSSRPFLWKPSNASR